ncbi:unnamed protein product [Brassica oleracea var. botrytis]
MSTPTTEKTHLQRLYWTYWASSATPPSFKEHPSIIIEISSKPNRRQTRHQNRMIQP